MAGAEHPTTSNHHEVASSPLAAAITVSDTLDRLWEEYLRALDEYEAAQRELQQHMSRVSLFVGANVDALSLTWQSGLLLASPGEFQLLRSEAVRARLLRWTDESIIGVCC